MVSKWIIDSGLSLDWISLQIASHWVRNTDYWVRVSKGNKSVFYGSDQVFQIRIFGCWRYVDEGLRFKEYMDSVSKVRFSLVFSGFLDFGVDQGLRFKEYIDSFSKVRFSLVFLRIFGARYLIRFRIRVR